MKHFIDKRKNRLLQKKKNMIKHVGCETHNPV
jgi:hypothetical protein